MKIVLNRDDLLDLQIALKKEYLLTNGKGGYCSSTIHDCHTRKYHGLLVLPLKNQQKVYNLLSKLEVNAVIDKKDFRLSTNKFPIVYNPTGHKYVEKFEYDDAPVTTYKIGDTIITKSLVMPKEENTVLVKYEVLKSEKPILFKVTPLLAYRDIHSLAKENMNINPRTYFEKNGFKIEPYEGLPPLYIQSSIKSVFYPSPEWWNNFEYLKERNRGYEYQEDLFTPGLFEIKCSEGKSFILRASTDTPNANIVAEWDKEIMRIEKASVLFDSEKEPLQSFKKKAKQFIFKNDEGESGMIAGYHWFREWGRDTMIALPGLTWMSGDKKTGLSILKKYAGWVRNGLLPDMVSEFGHHHYNAVDPSLLYFWTIQQFIESTGDKASVTKYLLPSMMDIIRGFLKGQVPNVSLGTDGFLYLDNGNEAATWMDARVNGNPVTPRTGAPVEINALWYNALKFISVDYKSKLSKDLQDEINLVVGSFESNFEEKFWNEPDSCLLDVYQSHNQDSSFIRPNQLFAIALPYTVIPKDKAAKIIETIKSHLVTAYGLRTLSPRNPGYRSEYKGEERIRDEAYHNGMVWPWTIGIYMDAMLKVLSKDEVQDYFKSTFWKLWDKHMDMYGLFHVSELFRPNPPQVAKGCMAQAWSLAEIIRVLETLK